jgi:hypothetical protein
MRVRGGSGGGRGERTGPGVLPSGPPRVGGPFLVAVVVSLTAVALVAFGGQRAPPVPPAPIVGPCPHAESAPVPDRPGDGPRSRPGDATVRRNTTAVVLTRAAPMPADPVECDVVAVLDRGDA